MQELQIALWHEFRLIWVYQFLVIQIEIFIGNVADQTTVIAVSKSDRNFVPIIVGVTVVIAILTVIANVVIVVSNKKGILYFINCYLWVAIHSFTIKNKPESRQFQWTQW